MSFLRDSCIKRRIRKGKEAKVYMLLRRSNFILSCEGSEEKLEIADVLSTRVFRIKNTYNITSGRVRRESLKNLEYYHET